MRVRNVLVCLTCLMLMACASRPDYVLDEDAMTALLVDIHMSEGLIDVQGRKMGEHKNYGQEVMAAVLLDHGVTRAQYDTSLVWYSQHLKKLIRVYNRVDKELDERIKMWLSLANEHGSAILSVEGDNVDVWGLDRQLMLDASRKQQSRYWVIATDSCFLPGDTLCWKLHSYDLPEKHALVASAVLTTDNELFSTQKMIAGTTSVAITNDSTVVLRVAAERDVKIKKIILSLNLLHDNAEETRVMAPALIDSIGLIRIHRNQ